MNENAIYESTKVHEAKKDEHHLIKESVLDAEKISALQIIIEQKITEEQTPENNWEMILHEYLSTEQFAQYREVIMRHVHTRRFLKNEIDKLWKMIEPYAKSQEVLAQDLYKLVGGDDLDIFSRVEKEDMCLKFYIKEEYQEAVFKTSVGRMISGLRVPVLFLKGDTSTSEQDTIDHEKQHVKNTLLHDDHLSNLKFIENRNPVEQRLVEYEMESDPVEKRIADELLACATSIHYLSLYSDETTKEDIVEYYITGTADMIQKSYIPRYLEEHPEYKDKKEEYEKKALESVRAIQELAKIYQPIFGKEYVSMVINVLNQFPLVKWPAVARLAISKRKFDN